MVTTMSEVDLEPVRAQVEVLRMTTAKIKELQALQKIAREIVETVMGEHSVGTLDGEPVVNWSHYKENRFDGAAFREDHPELWEQYKGANAKRRFEVITDGN